MKAHLQTLFLGGLAAPLVGLTLSLAAPPPAPRPFAQTLSGSKLRGLRPWCATWIAGAATDGAGDAAGATIATPANKKASAKLAFYFNYLPQLCCAAILQRGSQIAAQQSLQQFASRSLR